MIIAEVDASAAGRTTGQIVALLLLALGILKCWSISRRPTTNTKCVLGLMLFLTAWLLAAFGNAFLLGDADLRAVFGLLALLALGSAISGIVLAIIGLVEYSQQQKTYVQGRAQAIWTLVLSGLFVGLMVFGAVRGFSNRNAIARQQPSGGTPLVFDDLNFKFFAPGRPWAQMDASKVNRYAKLAFTRGSPNVYFIIIAERIGDADMSTDSLAEIAQAHMQGAAESLQVTSRSSARIGSLEGLRVCYEARLAANRFAYVQWLCVTNGWAYQLMAWGQAAERKRVAEEADRMAERFELLDYERRPTLMGQHVAADFVSTNYLYSVHCGDGNWLPWENLDTDFPQASFGVLHKRDAALTVSAVSLMDLQPYPESIYCGCLAAAGLSESSTSHAERREIRGKFLEGIETTVNQHAQNRKEYTYRVRILHGGGFAYMLAAWVESNHPQKEKLLAEALSRVEFMDGQPTAPERASMSEREKRVHRIILSSIGLVYYGEQQYEQSARFFKTSVDLDGLQKNTLHLANLTQAHISTGKYREALDELDLHPEFVNTQPGLQASRAFLQGRLGQVDLALTNYTALFATGYRDEGHFMEYVGLLAQAEQVAKALVEVEDYLKKQDSPDVRLLQAGLLKRQKNFDQAIALLQTQRQKNPFHAGIGYSLADAFIQAARPNEALAMSKEMLKQQGSSAKAWFLKGRAEFGLKWYREAKESFERAAKDSPSDPDVQSFLQFVSGMLGEGSNVAIKEPITPVPIPEALMTPLPPPAADYAREDGAYYSRRLTAVSFEKGKELKTTDYLSVKTLSVAGVSAFSTFQIPFNPLNEEIYVNRLEVREPSGGIVSTGRVSDYYLLDNNSGISASTRKTLNVPVSGLQPGYVVELTVTRRELGLADEFTFLPFTFQSTFPTRESMLFLAGNTGSVRCASSPILQQETVGKGLCWRRTDLPAFRWEPLLPQVSDYLPRVCLCDASARWPDLVTNYLGTIGDRFNLPAEQRELARRITAQATNQTQKIAAIAAYVQTNYTYKAIEFGRRARVPQFPADIVRNKYGDCKDHSLLAQQMLAAAGVPASLALASFNAPIRKELPSLDQFDHMIVYIQGTGGDLFLDCTSKSANLNVSWTSGLAGRDALILDGNNPRFIRIPDYTTNASAIHTTRFIQQTNLTEALVHETLTFEGVHAGFFRDYFRNQPMASRHSYVASQLVSTSGELMDMAFDGLEQPQSPLVLRLTYLVRGQFHALENQIVGSLPLGFERSFLLNEAIDKRVSPFEVAVPLTMAGVVTVIPQSGYKLTSLPESTQNIESRFITGQTTTETVTDGWRFAYHLHEASGLFPAKDYAEHYQALQQAAVILRPRLVSERVRR